MVQRFRRSLTCGCRFGGDGNDLMPPADVSSSRSLLASFRSASISSFGRLKRVLVCDNIFTKFSVMAYPK